MKTTLRLLASAAACGFSLSSCVVDPYGMPVAGGVYPAATYSSVNYYDNDPWGYGAFAPPVTSVGFFSGGWGGGWGNGWGNGWGGSCNRPVVIHQNDNCHGGGFVRHGRSISSSHHYASQVTRPSTFRGAPLMSSPPPTPSLPSPRTLSRPRIRSIPAPAPSRSFSAPPSAPRPSGRADRPSPGIASFSPPPSVGRSSMSTVAASSGRFGGVPSDRRRER